MRRTREFAQVITNFPLEQSGIAAGVTDMRRGFDGLSGQVQTVLQQQQHLLGPRIRFSRGSGDMVKVLWWDGDGLCLFAKRLERGRFIWPQADRGWCV